MATAASSYSDMMELLAAGAESAATIVGTAPKTPPSLLMVPFTPGAYTKPGDDDAADARSNPFAPHSPDAKRRKVSAYGSGGYGGGGYGGGYGGASSGSAWR